MNYSSTQNIALRGLFGFAVTLWIGYWGASAVASHKAGQIDQEDPQAAKVEASAQNTSSISKACFWLWLLTMFALIGLSMTWLKEKENQDWIAAISSGLATLLSFWIKHKNVGVFGTASGMFLGLTSVSHFIF
jgi:hypothetical protein